MIYLNLKFLYILPYNNYIQCGQLESGTPLKNLYICMWLFVYIVYSRRQNAVATLQTKSYVTHYQKASPSIPKNGTQWKVYVKKGWIFIAVSYMVKFKSKFA